MKLVNTVINILYEMEIKEIRSLISEAIDELNITDESKKFLENIGLMFGKGYVKWIIIKLIQHQIKEEDIYKYKGYFKYFEKGKKLGYFTYNDILQYKNADEFNNEVIKAHEKLIGFQGENFEQDEKYLVSPQQIQTLENVGIKYLGLTPDGYQCFKIPQELKGNTQAYEIQKNILGRCQGRERGAMISICTMGKQNHFDSYLETDDLYIFFNLKDPKSPYQFHYQSGQFNDKNNNSII